MRNDDNQFVALCYKGQRDGEKSHWRYDSRKGEWATGKSWGLRFYATGKDVGVRFTTQLYV